MMKNAVKLLVKYSFCVIFLTVSPQSTQAQSHPGDCNIGDRISCWLPCRPCRHRPQAQCRVREVQVGCRCEQVWFENGQQVPCTPMEQPPTRNTTLAVQTVQTPQPTPASECPPGVRLVQCFVNPCDVTSCPAFPNATCLANYCGGCFAEFYQSGRRVDCTAPNRRHVTNAQRTTAPSGRDVTNAQFTAAPNGRDVTSAQFTAAPNGRDVTSAQLTTGPSESQLELSRPGTPDGSARSDSVPLTTGQAGVSTVVPRRPMPALGRFFLSASNGQQQAAQDRPASDVASVQAQPAGQRGPGGVARTTVATSSSSLVPPDNQTTTEPQGLQPDGITTPALTSSGVRNVSLPSTNQTGNAANSNASVTNLPPAATCAPGVKQVPCTEDPCAGQTCDTGDAQCRASGCGSCHAEWYLGDSVVQCREACSARMISARCPIDPCAIQSCDEYPEAVCRTRTCGACRAEWFVTGRRVTHECFSARSVDVCPAGQESTCQCDWCPSNYSASCRIRGCGNSCRLEYFTVNSDQEEVVRCSGVFQSH